MNVLLAIFLGGGLGSLARFGVGKLAVKWSPEALPIGTFIANLLACAVLVVAAGYFARNQLSENWKAFVMIGFCGGFSTFSTFSFETFHLIKEGAFGWAIANVLVSVIACLGIMYLLARN